MYLLTGSLAFVAGIFVVLFMPDSPLHARFLTRKERVIALERVRDGQGGTENKTLKKPQVFEALSDVRTWLIVLLTCMSKFFFHTFYGDAINVLLLAAIPNGSLSNCEPYFCEL